MRFTWNNITLKSFFFVAVIFFATALCITPISADAVEPIEEPAATEISPSGYLTFSSPESFTLGTSNNTKNWDGTLEYSIDTLTWSVWDGETLTSSEGGKLYLRGTGNSMISNSTGHFTLMGCAISCTGNIEILLDYQKVASGIHPVMGEECFSNLFKDCTSLTEAPDLPATTLTPVCYYQMFMNCTGLTAAPELPATLLAYSCYDSMFLGCTGIKLSETETGEYTKSWGIPLTATPTTSWNLYMFSGTGGTFTGSPEIGKTYYLYVPTVIPAPSETPTTDTRDQLSAVIAPQVIYDMTPSKLAELTAPTLSYGKSSLLMTNISVMKTVGDKKTEVSASVNADGTITVTGSIDDADSLTVTFPGRTLGDVTGEGSPDTLDAARLLQASAKLYTLDKEAAFYGDVSGDGETNTFDAARILQYSAKLTDENYNLLA